MTEKFTQEPLSTPDQAAAIFAQIGELTALQGKNYGDSHSFGEVSVVVPEGVATHLPSSDVDSESVRRTLYVTQKLNKTGEPKREGVVGLVSFSQKERRDADLLYATHVNYHVVTDDGETFRLERHVTNTEHGKHQVAQQLAARSMVPESMETQLAGLLALKARVEESRKAEAELGLSTVSSLEADEIAQTLASFNGNK